MSCGVGRKHGWDLVLLWLWHRPAATALIGPLAWEPSYATEAAQETAKRQKKKKKYAKAVGFVHNGEWNWAGFIYLFFLGLFVVVVVVIVAISWAAPAAYGGSQARG